MSPRIVAGLAKETLASPASARVSFARNSLRDECVSFSSRDVETIGLLQEGLVGQHIRGWMILPNATALHHEEHEALEGTPLSWVQRSKLLLALRVLLHG